MDQIHNGSHDTGENLEKLNTTITVRSVKFIGAVPSQGLLNLGTGNWTYEATEEGAYEFAPATPVYFKLNDSNASTDAANKYKPLKTGNLVLPTIAENRVKIQVVYDVTTVDNENPRNNSTITNTITSTGDYALEKGHYYTFKLDLGLTSVKFNVTEVKNWDTESEQIVDLPNNLYPGLTAVSYISAATQPSTCAAGDVYFNTTSSNWFEAESTNTWRSTALSPATVYYNAANGKYYDEATFNSEHTMSTGYYLVGGILYKKA